MGVSSGVGSIFSVGPPRTLKGERGSRAQAGVRGRKPQDGHEVENFKMIQIIRKWTHFS